MDSPSETMLSRRERGILSVLLLCILAFFLLTLRPGHSWGGDFSLYILHARNLVEGVPYNDTPYVYNPDFAAHSPQSYPPVFPFLLAPVYAVFGLNYQALKIVGVLSHTAAVGLLYLLGRRILSWQASLAVVALMGFNPIYWTFKDEVLPDLTYVAFAFAALAWMERAEARDWNRSRPVLAAAVGAMLFALAYGSRSVGLTLAPAVVLHEVWRRRRPTRFVWIYSGLVVCSILLVSTLIPSDRNYLEQLRGFSIPVLVENAVEYLRSFAFTWANGHFRPLQYLLFAVSLAGGAWAWSRDLAQFQVTALYALFYLGLVLLWPSANGTRYILPVIPLFILYSVQGWLRLARFLPASAGQAATLALAVLLAISYAGRYRQLPTGGIPGGISEPEFVQLREYITRRTDPASMIYFWNPRVLALYTRRESATYSPAAGVMSNWKFFLSRSGRYVVVRKNEEEDRRHLSAMVEAHAGEFVRIFENARYELYERKASAASPASPNQTHAREAVSN